MFHNVDLQNQSRPLRGKPQESKSIGGGFSSGSQVPASFHRRVYPVRNSISVQLSGSIRDIPACLQFMLIVQRINRQVEKWAIKTWRGHCFQLRA